VNTQAKERKMRNISESVCVWLYSTKTRNNRKALRKISEKRTKNNLLKKQKIKYRNISKVAVGFCI